MTQTEKLSIEEAIILVESKARNTINGEHLPFGTQEYVMQVLQQDGRDIQTDGKESEVALFAALVMSLVAFLQGNALILTTNEATARAFFEKRLFAENGQTGKELASRCGKTLELVSMSSDLKEIEVALNDPNVIPVMETAAFKRTDSLSFEASLKIRQDMSWWEKLRSSISSSPALSPLREGLAKLIFIARVSGQTVSVEQGGVLTATVWIHNPPKQV